MFSIRTASLDDIPLIRQLTFQVWPQTYASIISKEQIDYMLDLMYSENALARQMTDERCSFLIVYDNNEPAGFAAFSETSPHIFKLHKIYILPSQQGKGTGKFVIDYVLDAIGKQGAIALQLQVNRYNKARTFYEKLGFSTIDEKDFDIGNGFFMNDLVLEFRL